MQKLFIHCHVVDPLLHSLERRKEDRVHDAGSRHRDTQSAVHARIHELYLRSCRFVTAANEAVALVDRFRGIDGKDLQSVSLRPCSAEERVVHKPSSQDHTTLQLSRRREGAWEMCRGRLLVFALRSRR